MSDCPSCESKKTEIFWGIVRWCKECFCCSLVRDPRYYLVCPTDGHRLVPRSNFKEPTLFCMKCHGEFEPPGEAAPQIMEDELD